MAEVKTLTWGGGDKTWTTRETVCKNCNCIFPYTLVEHVCPDKHGRLHFCMRCELLFECKTEGCQAQYKVFPTRIVNGKLVEHCPEHPSWEWIREHALVFSEQRYFTEGLEIHAYGRCTKRDIRRPDGCDWRCLKREGHEGTCSTHNDCGAVASDKATICGWPPNHCGRHAWDKNETQVEKEAQHG